MWRQLSTIVGHLRSILIHFRCSKQFGAYCIICYKKWQTCNLPTSATCFLTVFQEKIKKLCRNSRNYTKNLSDLGKKLKDLRKTQEYEALLGLLGLQKVHKKQAWLRVQVKCILRVIQQCPSVVLHTTG